MGECRYEGCGHKDNSRPYARKRDGVPTASGIASLLDTGKSRSFAWAASLIAATEAVHHADNWQGLVGQQSDRAVKNGHTGECTEDKDGLCKACVYLRSEFDRRWTEKANLGNHLHHLALAWAKGEPVDTDDVTDPYLDSLERFYKDCSPEWVEMERTVLYDKPVSHSYRGTFDAVVELDCPAEGHDRCTWLVDYKSGGYWPAEQTLQLSAYRFAQHVTDWADGAEKVTGPMPAVAHAGVLLLRPDLAQLVELPADGEAHGTFLRLVDAWRWSKQVEKWSRDHPLEGTEE